MRTYKSMRLMLILESQGYIIKVVSVLDVGPVSYTHLTLPTIYSV